MQSSHTTDDVRYKGNELKQHQPVKQVRSHDIARQKPKEPQAVERARVRNNRSTSAGLRHSIRHLTSCALARRKPGRPTSSADQNLSTADLSAAFEDNHLLSPKSQLIPNEPAPSSLKKSQRQIEQLKKTTSDGTSSTISLHKQLEKKNSSHAHLTISAGNSPIPSPLTPIDDISIVNIRKLTNKEISTSLVNLMGTASDSVSPNSTTPSTAQQTRHISATPASSTDRLGSFGSSSSFGATGLLDASFAQRSACTGNNQMASASPSSYTKSASDCTWCQESAVSTAASSSSDECLSELEVDAKPLMYRQHFESSEHFNWYGISETHGPVIISYKYANDQDRQRYIIAIIRTRQRTSIESLVDVSAPAPCMHILRRICEQCSTTDIDYFDPVVCDGTRDLLLKYDESHVSNKHKFGIIYQRADQVTEEDIFSNETHSIAMNKFLALVGNRVKLKDFQGFRGGLDNKSDHTGTESIYERFHEHEIMFHVSTLLPHSKSERQQLERKRHIGNDIVAIVFQENETNFNPECIASQFLHAYLVVTPLDSDGNQFKVSVVHRDSVPTFGPATNPSRIFQCDQIFKQWLLTKLINAEMASCRSSTFQKYQERTKMSLFDNLYRTLHDNNRPFMDFILNHSQHKHECELEQHRDDAQVYPSTKTYDRHGDNSLLGSVKRRFIAPKVRVQHSNSPTPTTYIISSPTANNTGDPKLKVRSLADDVKRGMSKDVVASNGQNNHGKMASIFSSSKNHNAKTDSSDSSTNTKSPSPISTEPNSTSDSNLPTATFNSNSSSADDTDLDLFSLDHLQSLTKDELIKTLMALQQQNASKLAHMNQIHSQTIQQLKIKFIQQSNSVDKETP